MSLGSFSFYSFTGSIQTVTVATTGTYDITAYGAQGGAGFHTSGGYGAEIEGTFTLTAGERLEIVVGGHGISASSAGGGGGGGGGSFVLASTNGGASYDLLIAAGGGGGGLATNGANAYFAPADKGSGYGGSRLGSGSGGGGGGSVRDRGLLRRASSA